MPQFVPQKILIKKYQFSYIKFSVSLMKSTRINDDSKISLFQRSNWNRKTRIVERLIVRWHEKRKDRWKNITRNMAPIKRLWGRIKNIFMNRQELRRKIKNWSHSTRNSTRNGERSVLFLGSTKYLRQSKLIEIQQN